MAHGIPPLMLRLQRRIRGVAVLFRSRLMVTKKVSSECKDSCQTLWARS